jgi:hypothetical protein
MERVQQVVDWAVNEDMYIILNTHHEEYNATNSRGVFTMLDDSMDEAEIFLTRIWEQIGERFKDYDEKLIFEGLNEPRTIGSSAEWTGGTAGERANLNRLNQLFVDVVRQTGGFNDRRILMVPTIAAAASSNAFDGFVIPDDPIGGNDKIALSIHTYTPSGFSFTGPISDWDINVSIDRTSIETALNRVADNAANLGVPVILGEWGTVNKENTDARAAHAEFYARVARELGMVTVWWDNGQINPGAGGRTDADGFGLIARAAPHEVQFPRIIDAIIRGTLAGGWVPPQEWQWTAHDEWTPPAQTEAPVIITTEPPETTTEPPVTTTEPSVTTAEPSETTAEPSETTDVFADTEVFKWDIDGDGAVTIADALEILKYLAGLENMVDFEAVIDDALEILKYLAGLPSVIVIKEEY